jgi:hypothetical protein
MHWSNTLLLILSLKTSGKACLDIHVVWAVARYCWNQPYSLSSSFNSGKNYLIMTSTYLFQLIVLLKTQIQQSFLHLQYTVHQLSLVGIGLHGEIVDSMDSSSNYFVFLCSPISETSFHWERISIADRSHLRRQTVETNCKNEPC